MAAAAAVSALVAVAPRELVVPVPAQRLDPAPLPREPEFPVLAPPVPGLVPVVLGAPVLFPLEPQLPPPAQPRIRVPLVPSPLPLRLHLEVGAVEAGAQLLSRQSFSAAMAESSPSPGEPTYEPVPRSRWPRKGRPCPSS